MGKKQKWAIGDVVAIENLDKLFSVAQIVGQEPSVLNSVSVAFFDERYSSLDEIKKAVLALESIIAIQFSTRDSLDNGKWKVVDSREVAIPSNKLPYEHLRAEEFVGAKVIGSGILRDFLNAYYGLSPWDDWKDPNYLDSFLISKEKKPTKLMFKNSKPTQ